MLNICMSQLLKCEVLPLFLISNSSLGKSAGRTYCKWFICIISGPRKIASYIYIYVTARRFLYFNLFFCNKCFFCCCCSNTTNEQDIYNWSWKWTWWRCFIMFELISPVYIHFKSTGSFSRASACYVVSSISSSYEWSYFTLFKPFQTTATTI